MESGKTGIVKQVRRIGPVQLVLLLSLLGTGFAEEKPGPPSPPRCADLTQVGPVAYDLEAMRTALAGMTQWDLTNWPEPRIHQLPPKAFQGRTDLDHHRFLGDFEAGTNQVFVNLTCRCQVPDNQEAFCRAVLFHELVHWGQYHSGLDKVIGPTDQERQALEYEAQYLETRLGIPDVYPPARPSPSELPPTTQPIRLTWLQPRTLVQDASGRRQALWILTGIWTDLSSFQQYRAQAIAHRGHWVGVEIFVINSRTGEPEQVEAWWDAGYVRHGTAFPAYPVHRGEWIRIK